MEAKDIKSLKKQFIARIQCRSRSYVAQVQGTGKKHNNNNNNNNNNNSKLISDSLKNI